MCKGSSQPKEERWACLCSESSSGLAGILAESGWLAKIEKGKWK